jgi:hypothetical protein
MYDLSGSDCAPWCFDRPLPGCVRGLGNRSDRRVGLNVEIAVSLEEFA